ncbi:uncharacterized protein LOC102077203 [Oreochromis niloticus]|uniref:uncharacterized protein LOC102077203 n=1 Tax=Oreochromis niloticus TaxID=8128 RepID=UPI00025FAB0E|nr:uncharacterized protein LOC102077203 [Oreochromis niloticus]XP_031613748.2 uncharacterized protein LOC116334460 [Oreochromis aureus]CAI5670838.1 unnamed protein product [Mustela putorius furo]
MILSSFKSFFIYYYLSSLFHPSHGFEVIQPPNMTNNPDTVFISCNFTANTWKIVDVRLNKVLPEKKEVLCQTESQACHNIIVLKDTPPKYIFILLNVGPEDWTSKYECECSATKTDGTDKTMLIAANKLIKLQLQGQLGTTPQCTPPPSPPLPQSHQLMWILIGLLALMFVYSCIITSFYMRLMNSSKDCENSTYVEMRNVPVQLHPHHIYNTMQKA